MKGLIINPLPAWWNLIFNDFQEGWIIWQQPDENFSSICKIKKYFEIIWLSAILLLLVFKNIERYEDYEKLC